MRKHSWEKLLAAARHVLETDSGAVIILNTMRHRVLETASSAGSILHTHLMRRAKAASSAASCCGEQCWRYPTHTLDAAGGDREQFVSIAG